MNGTRILVVDDEPQITRVLRRSLSSKGYEVQVAEDGEEALDVFREWVDWSFAVGFGKHRKCQF
jgi:CheY-like chemotaxis protein